MKIEDVIDIIKEAPSSLFYGTGITRDCGGPSWEDLLSDLKAKFPGTEEDPFKYMDEIISFDDSNRKEIEDFLRDRLALISPGENQKYLFSLPWRAVLTTNYDHLPDALGVTLDGTRQIFSISDPSEQIDHRRVDRLYCFKLLGDVKFSFPQHGWMVLSESDLFSAGDRRVVFFNQFRNLATTGHIIYLGHSFKDDIVFRILNQMKTTLGRFPWKGFAITPLEPNARIRKKLDSIGIEWVQGDLIEFVSAAKKRFGELPCSSPLQMGCLTIHQKMIDIDHSVFSNIHNKFSILHNERLKTETEKPIDFMRGTSESFFPFVYSWDYPRKTKLEWINAESRISLPQTLLDIKSRVKEVELSQNSFLALVGGAGSGKTIIANRLSFEWYQGGNPVIFVNPDNKSIDYDALDSLMNEIRDKYLAKLGETKKQESHPIRWLIVADDCGANLLGELRILRNHLISSGKPCDILLVSRETDIPVEKLKASDVDGIYKLDDTIAPQEIDSFLKHFRRLGILDEAVVQKNLNDREINSSFFALMYSCIRQSSENIKKLILDEYRKLDEESRNVYSYVSLIQAYRLRPLSSLVMKSGQFDPDWLQNQTLKGRLSGVVRYVDFANVLLTSNRLIAEIICDIAFPDSLERKLALSRVISAVTFGDYAEMSFLDALLNSRIDEDMGPRVSIAHKIDLFTEAIKKVPSRPLLIHLGRIQTNAQRFKDAKKTLVEAHLASVPGFDEMDEHVLDAEGRLEFTLAEYAIRQRDEANAWDHLEKAEEFFTTAKINPHVTPHPYEGIARVFLAKKKLARQEELQWIFILAAMRECNYVENYLGESSEISLIKMEIEDALTQIGFNETHIHKISEPVGKANAYAYLAEQAMSNRSLNRSLELVEKGLESDASNIWLMRLKVKLLRLLSPDSHDAIMNTLDDYEAVSDKNFDIELSFELAKETYISGCIPEAKALFKKLGFKAAHHPRRLIPRDPVDRWMEKGKPMRLTGTLVRVPTEDRYGSVYTTFPSTFKDYLVVRKRDIQFREPAPNRGERVTYEIIFNMLGPEASRVRR